MKQEPIYLIFDYLRTEAMNRFDNRQKPVAALSNRKDLTRVRSLFESETEGKI
jgi:hypothetical protein